MTFLNQTLRLNKAALFDAKQILGLLLSAYFLLFIYPKTGLDQRLIAPYFDVATQRFALKNQPFLAHFMHTGLKYCMILIALSTLFTALKASTPGHPLSSSQHQLDSPCIHEGYRHGLPPPSPATSFSSRLLHLFNSPYFLAFVGMVVSTSVVSFFKSISMHACPSQLSLYGGDLPLLNLFDYLPNGVKAGHCFPGGHASGGFALMAFYFAFRESKPQFAVMMLALGLLLGFAMGWAQMMRGEHFLSHNLWSAWLVWLVLFALFLIKKMTEKN